jgi:anti-anti-sigma regulatory factor
MPSEFIIGQISNGIVIRLVGRGTMRESPAFRTAAERGLNSGLVVFDATRCEYLDSTFLGCLIGLKKSCEQLQESRFLIAASSATRIKLFCTSSLDRYFDFLDECPEVLDQCAPIDIEELKRDEFGLHIMRCHERLAEMGGKEAPAFQAIADRLAKELGNNR